jgi:[ribosomal protein S5]-alanine N-acetyltransferase
MMRDTLRLTYRVPVPADALPMAALAGDWDVASMTGQLPYPYSLANAERYIAELPKNDPLRRAFAILHRGHLIGICGYTANGLETGSVGYWIGKSNWGRGFATEAVTALVSGCFESTRLQALTCAHFIENCASARVIAKVGFKVVGPAFCWCEATQSSRDALTYALKAPNHVTTTPAEPRQ